MKANELRIGNWVKRTTQPEGFQIDSHSFIVCERNPSMYEPIPLTEEWLVKLGFKKRELSLSHNTKLYVCLKTENEYFNDGKCLILAQECPYISMPCKYVHQLQNLYFALTGEELTLKDA